MKTPTQNNENNNSWFGLNSPFFISKNKEEKGGLDEGSKTVDRLSSKSIPILTVNINKGGDKNEDDKSIHSANPTS